MKACSFSARNDSTVMWGHYANSHSGFCLEYDLSKWPLGGPHRRMLYPVIYSPTIFDSTKHILQSMNGGIFNNLFGIVAAIHKSPDWSYEDEWRFLLPLGRPFPDQNHSMPSPPSAIYIGARASDADTEKLLDIAKIKGVQAYKMHLSTEEFKMVYRPI